MEKLESWELYRAFPIWTDIWTLFPLVGHKVAVGLLVVAQTVKNPSSMQETQVWSLDQEDPLEMEWLPASCYRIPWTEEPGGLQSMGSKESDITDHLTLSLLKLLLFEKPPVRNISCLWSRKHLLRIFYHFGLFYITCIFSWDTYNIFGGGYCNPFSVDEKTGG